ncbi:MAG: efflux RND transporter permease subunit [Puniceicoccales bacterium]|jgi:HAE1 family hydrophobic/amphiphilic exporter-1|nr:efflux RND transporter permease subunit [Puniceicoccales bacterium]
MANISEPFIRRPVFTMLLTLSAIIGGIFCYTQLPVSDLPNIDYPVIQVSAAFPGMDPETMAANVASPLEKEFMKIQGLDMVTSKSLQGTTTLTLQFDLNKNIDGAAMDVQAAITRASSNLPSDMPSPPVFYKTDPNSKPIYYIALTSDTLTRGQLYDYAIDEIAQRIGILKGVSNANAYGVARAIKIEVDSKKLYNKGLTVDDVTNAVRQGTVSLSAGKLRGENNSFTIKPSGQLKNASDYLNLVIASRGGVPIYLKDVAHCIEKLESDDVQNRLWMKSDGRVYKSNVVIAVTRAAGANAVELSKEIDDLLPVFEQQMPGSIKLIKMYDRSEKIIESINDVQMTLIVAFILVILVIFLFIGRVRETIIPLVAMPLSLCITFIVMHAFGFSLDNLSLMALTLSIGFLVDDAIVFLENMIRRMEDFGESPLRASLNGAKEISFSILSMTLSLAAVFIPLIFMSGQVGRVFREFSVTIIVAILASGVVSLTLTPMMCARMLKPIREGNRTRLEIASQELEKKFLKFYDRSLNWFLKHRSTSVLIWVICLVGSYLTFRALPKTFLPVGDSGLVSGIFITREGTSSNSLRASQELVCEALQKNPYVNQLMSVVGISWILTDNQGFVMAFLTKDKRPHIQKVVQMSTRDLYAIPGVYTAIRPMPNLEIGTGAIGTLQGKYAYILSCIDRATLYKAANELVKVLSSNPGFARVSTDIYVNTPQASVEYLRNQAYTYGVSPYNIENALKQSFSGNYCYQIKEGTRQYKVIVSAARENSQKIEDFDRLYFHGVAEELVPFSSVATYRETLGPLAINHTNNFPSVTIFFDLKDDYPVGEATKFLEQASKKIVPPGVMVDLEGEAKTFQESVHSLVILLFVAVFVMYVILGIMYESYIHPITVLSALPVAVVGGLLTLILFRMELSLYGYIGLFMLIGIVKKNGILVIDFAIARQREGMDTEKAIHTACMERFRPIIMTTLAALMGQVPIAIGVGADGASRMSLGLSIIGGLVVSQIITLYITPVIYLYLEDFQEKVLDKIPFFARELRE